MRDFEAIGKKYMTGDRAETLKAAAASPEGQRLAKMVDAKAVEDAARRGPLIPPASSTCHRAPNQPAPHTPPATARRARWRATSRASRRLKTRHRRAQRR